MKRLFSRNGEKKTPLGEKLPEPRVKEEEKEEEKEEDDDDRTTMIDDIDSDEDSEIVDESEDDGSDLEDFIVPDDEVDGMVIPPPNHATIDKEWNDWEPGSRVQCVSRK